ncbi:MAG TPA: ABC transporter ATP-binding protein [candidate division Zixibacteria bacterium]|nr:ABC transporter ATP-binding protein [candidate division Zixibacteria bacterium]MDD4917919.1 ABC transporter ATP-binding protein [candidate division Zixibacteria bacterium]HOD65216.1 ABC transporter ATP-binding protein [candidate division Zixibacteria bacterium]HPC10869.1 ABC transporter ATP-binding protein [candidate division Zixibacteria bacterium]HPM38157.1 ABC transporter ATP-binding protein [candidate division Zixibacteria bacterium]
MLIALHNVEKEYRTGAVSFKALKGVSLAVDRGEYLAIVGPSGSGKSTLMNLIGCLDVPSAGEYLLDGRPVGAMTSNQLADIRNQTIGFVFQAFNLLPYATSFENVEVPLLFARVPARQRKRRVLELLARVGLADKVSNKPTELSGGEMQRVAIARALANEPEIILADEPTGNLDTASGKQIIALFDELRNAGKTVIIITHDVNIAKQAPRIVRIRDGAIEENGYHPVGVNVQSLQG